MIETGFQFQILHAPKSKYRYRLPLVHWHRHKEHTRKRAKSETKIILDFFFCLNFLEAPFPEIFSNRRRRISNVKNMLIFGATIMVMNSITWVCLAAANIWSCISGQIYLGTWAPCCQSSIYHCIALWVRSLRKWEIGKISASGLIFWKFCCFR